MLLFQIKNFLIGSKKNSQKILENKDVNCLTYAITKSNKIKLSFATRRKRQKYKDDFKFYHTFAHAIEARHSYSKKLIMVRQFS